jgi:hypothetical protein
MSTVLVYSTLSTSILIVTSKIDGATHHYILLYDVGLGLTVVTSVVGILVRP